MSPRLCLARILLEFQQRLVLVLEVAMPKRGRASHAVRSQAGAWERMP